MNQYVFILNEQGERITSFVDNTVSKDELLDHPRRKWFTQQFLKKKDYDIYFSVELTSGA